MKPIIFVVLTLFSLLGCTALTDRTTFLWKSYEHPVYHFKIKFPRSWTLEEGGEMGTQISLLAPATDPTFRTNGNIVIEPIVKNFDLEKWAMLSAAQLTLILHDYRVVAQAQTTVAQRPAYVIRGIYMAGIEQRVIETTLLATDDLQYALTFNMRKETENEYRSAVDGIRSSLSVPSSLKDAR